MVVSDGLITILRRSWLPWSPPYDYKHLLTFTTIPLRHSSKLQLATLCRRWSFALCSQLPSSPATIDEKPNARGTGRGGAREGVQEAQLSGSESCTARRLEWGRDQLSHDVIDTDSALDSANLNLVYLKHEDILLYSRINSAV